MARRRLRAGLVGGGPWAGDVHAPGLAAHDGFELVAVWARRPAVAERLAALHDAVACGELDELFDAVDVVSFAVPPGVQADLAVDAVRAGRHVILDKPIAGTLAAAESLAGEVASAGVASIVLFVLRFAPETRAWLDDLADLGATGGWAGGTARWLSGKLLDAAAPPSPWRHELGSLADIGAHAFDLLDAALGPVSGVRAASHSEPDLWHVVLEHDSGAHSTASMSLRLPIDPSVVEFDVYGSAGRRVLTARQTPPAACYATMLDELVAMIDVGGTEHPCDVRRGLHVQRIIEQARRLAD